MEEFPQIESVIQGRTNVGTLTSKKVKDLADVPKYYWNIMIAPLRSEQFKKSTKKTCFVVIASIFD